MKNIKIFAMLAIFAVSTAFGQEYTGEQTADPAARQKTTMLPQAGDIAIGIEAAPFFEFIGNMWNVIDHNPSPVMNFLSNGNTIFAKYFLEDNMAVRARLGFRFHSDEFNAYVTDEFAVYNDPLSRDLIVDTRSFSRNDYLIAAELELRRGYDRLQGYFGGGVVFSINNQNNKYYYGNAISEIVPTPDSHNFNGNVIGDTRVLETYNVNNNIGGGLNGFVGVEYFILPKISMGGEMGLSFIYTKWAQTKQIIEFWDGFQVVEEVTMTSPGDRTMRGFITNPSVGIFIMFHF